MNDAGAVLKPIIKVAAQTYVYKAIILRNPNYQMAYVPPDHVTRIEWFRTKNNGPTVE